MYKKNIEKTIRILRDNDFQFKRGMTEKEIRLAEDIYNIKFPLDYKALLMTVVPYDAEPDEDGFSYTFTDWTNTSTEYVESIKEWIDYSTLSGVLSTVERLDGWRGDWGNKPTDIAERLSIAQIKCKESPIFIPVVGGRFLALTPQPTNNPVHSIHQGCDIVPYGYTIWDFFVRDFTCHHLQDVNLKKIAEPVSNYNEFIYESINNFFYQGQIVYNRAGQCLKKCRHNRG